AVRDELVDLFEGARIEQQFDPLARGQLAGGVLLVAPFAAAAELGGAFELRECPMWIHQRGDWWLGRWGHGDLGTVGTRERVVPSPRVPESPLSVTPSRAPARAPSPSPSGTSPGRC